MNINTNDLNEEMFKYAEDKLRELDELKNAVAIARMRVDRVKADLIRSMATMGLVEHGDSLTSAQLNVYVKLAETKQYRVNKKLLKSLGVSDDNVDKAGNGKTARPNLRFKRLRNKKQESTQS